jgi:membrane protein DedA with SNARE-associated domain
VLNARFVKATAVFGWLLILVGTGYLVISVRDALGGIQGWLARMLVGLVAVVVGGSIVRWVRRAR